MLDLLLQTIDYYIFYKNRINNSIKIDLQTKIESNSIADETISVINNALIH